MITKEIFMDIKAMNRNGLSIRRIANITGLHRKTVKRHLEGMSLPEYHKTKRKGSILDPFRPMIDAYLEEDDYQKGKLGDRFKGICLYLPRIMEEVAVGIHPYRVFARVEDRHDSFLYHPPMVAEPVRRHREEFLPLGEPAGDDADAVGEKG